MPSWGDPRGVCSVLAAPDSLACGRNKAIARQASVIPGLVRLYEQARLSSRHVIGRKLGAWIQTCGFFICAAGAEPIQLSGPLVRLHRKWLSGRLVTCSACSTSTNASSQRRPCIFGNRRKEYRWSFCRGGRQMCHSSQSSTRLALTNYTFECARVFKTSCSNTNIVTFVINSFPV